MRRPLLLDLYCGAGGAAVGYHRAGFDVVGVDLKPQPRFPFAFILGDALDVLATSGRYFAAIHASPPCQAHTTMSNRWRGQGGKADAHEKLIGVTRALLEGVGRPFVIENVPGARRELRTPVTLHGGMFGLRVHRPRLFDASFPLTAPEGQPVRDPIGVYGKAHDGRRLFTRADGSIQRAARSLDEGRDAMGVDWMEWRELAESIPPAYTEHVGRQLLAALTSPTEAAA